MGTPLRQRRHDGFERSLFSTGGQVKGTAFDDLFVNCQGGRKINA
jgi:hypothetical protein